MQAIVALLLFAKSSYGAGWDYEDMAHWDDHYEQCGTSDQSPINIKYKNSVHDTSVCDQHTFNWTVDWTQSTWQVVNNGHSIVVIPVEQVSDDYAGAITGSDDNKYISLTSHDNSIGRLRNQFLPEHSPHSEFCLHSFHFHWAQEDDTGSEHLIDDHQYPLEVHFVHYSCNTSLGATLTEYNTTERVEAAIANGDDTHTLAVVGIMFDIEEYDNPAFDAILPYDVLDNEQYPKGSSENTIITDLDLTDMVPDEVFTDGFYAYEGSLTTPPCTNIVRWHVMNAVSYIGRAQIERFRLLMQSKNATVEEISMGPNYRDVQENENTVYACFEERTTTTTESATNEGEEEEERSSTEVAVIWVYTVFILLVMCAFCACCYYRSVREQQAVMAEPEKKGTRGRAMSRSSIGTDTRRQSRTQTSDHGAHH